MKNWLYSLLRSSEQYTKTDMVYLFENGIWTTLRQAGAALTVLVSSLIFAHFVSEEVYGIYKYLISISGVVSSFLLLGSSIGASRYASQGYLNSLRHSFKETLIWSAPATLVALSISVYYIANGNMTLGFGLLAISIFIPLTYAAMNWSGFLIGVKDFKNITALATFVSFGTTIATIVAIYFSKNPLFIFLAYLISGAILNLLAYKISLKKYEKPSPIIPRKEFFVYSLHQTLNGALPLIASQADKIFVFQQMGAVELAIYSFAIAIPEQINALFANISRIAFPKFVNRSLYEIKKNLWARMAGFTLVALIASGAYILFAPFIYGFLFPKYMASVPYSQILSLFIFTSLANIPLAVLQAHGRNIPLYTNTVFTSVAQIILNYFLISSYGLMGAIASTALTKIITLIVGVVTLLLLKEEPLQNVPTVSPSQ